MLFDLGCTVFSIKRCSRGRIARNVWYKFLKCDFSASLIPIFTTKVSFDISECPWFTHDKIIIILLQLQNEKYRFLSVIGNAFLNVYSSHFGMDIYVWPRIRKPWMCAFVLCITYLCLCDENWSNTRRLKLLKF